MRLPDSYCLAQVSVLLQSGALDPVELCQETLRRIEAHGDPAVFISVTPERALAEARAAAERIAAGRSRGALDGVPIAWKDLFDIAGMATTAGSKVLADAPPAGRDAAVVAALTAAGMVNVGRVNMSEFAFSGIGINPNYGTPHNPASRDVPRIPGGSSSGSAVAVAAGIVAASIGSDTGGSVRIPAALNGLVGYKATMGRYPMSGVFPLARSLDSLGPLCRTVQDAVLIDAALRNRTAPDVARGTLAGQSVIIPETVVFDGAEAGVVAAFEAAIGRLEKAGVRVRRRKMPEIAEIFDVMARHGPLVTAEAYGIHRDRLESERVAMIDPRVVKRTLLGRDITLTGYLATLEARRRLIAAIGEATGPNELFAYPTVAHVAPPIAPLVENDELFVATNAKTLRNTLIGNFLDWCGVSIPCGTGEAGMPVGLLLSGLPGTDENLLSVALAAEPVIRAGA